MQSAAWDFTTTQPFILADLAIDGQERKVIMHAPRNGYLYVLDRITGKIHLRKAIRQAYDLVDGAG